MQRDTENPAPATAPRQLRAPVTPRNSAANAAPVHIDDALAKRAKAALETRSQVVHACAEANIAYACVQELQDALAKSRGVTAALRSNYQELYDMLQRGGAQQAGAAFKNIVLHLSEKQKQLNMLDYTDGARAIVRSTATGTVSLRDNCRRLFLPLSRTAWISSRRSLGTLLELSASPSRAGVGPDKTVEHLHPQSHHVGLPGMA